MDNCFIKPADIKVVPYFKTNEDLAKSICWELNSYLKRKDFTGNQPLQGPTFLVFRPSGRAGDEFKDTVTPHLKEGSPQYLIIASSTKPTDTFGISDDDEKRLQRHKTRIVINQGSLVASPENYHDYNNDSLKKLAVAICKDYSDCVSFREALNKKKPETKGFFDKYFNISGSGKDSHGPVPEAIEKKKQGHSEIPIKWFSIVGQSVTDVEMAPHVPESSSSVQTMASTTDVQVKAQEVGQRDQGHEPIMQEAQQDDYVHVPDGTEDEIVAIRPTTGTCRFCRSSIHDDDEVVKCQHCYTKQKRESEWMCSLYFLKDPQRLYSVSSDVMMKCLEGRGVKENEIVNFLLTCGKIRYTTYNENDMAIGNEG